MNVYSNIGEINLGEFNLGDLSVPVGQLCLSSTGKTTPSLSLATEVFFTLASYGSTQVILGLEGTGGLVVPKILRLTSSGKTTVVPYLYPRYEEEPEVGPLTYVF